MEAESADPSLPEQEKTSDGQSSVPVTSGQNYTENRTSSPVSDSGISSWARNLKLSLGSGQAQGDSNTENGAKSTFARFTSGLGLRWPPATPAPDGAMPAQSSAGQTGVLESVTKGLVDSSRSAVKAVQVKARHMVSQNKRTYQEGEFDLDMTYITDNIIAMGFPAGDISSGIFGYVEVESLVEEVDPQYNPYYNFLEYLVQGFYRNHMEEVIKFFETRHQAASFPFDDHNCPSINLISSFCQSAYAWLKEDIDNIVVVHCKAGLGRTGLMISSLLLYLKFCPTAEESIDYFNQKRCIDGKGLVHPSQIRYVKYFERVLKDYPGNSVPARRCMLRGFRLHKCPYWIRPSITISDHNGILFTTKKHPKTKDLMLEDFWINTSKKGIVIFALPGEPGLTELAGDFKVHFHDRHGDFYCWFNTTLTENRIIMNSDDLDGFDKRKLPSPTFQVEIVMIDYDGIPKKSNTEQVNTVTDGSSDHTITGNNAGAVTPNEKGSSRNEDRDDVFSDSDGEEGRSSRSNQAQASIVGPAANNHGANLTGRTQEMSIGSTEPTQKRSADPIVDGANKSGSGVEPPSGATDFKVMAADASVFSFGDDEDYESE